jgi:hypothetical protein
MLCLTRALAIFLLICSTGRSLEAQGPAQFEKHLLDGSISTGIEELSTHLKTHDGDDQARFQLGLLQFLRSVERLGGSFYRYGVLSDLQLPILRIPVPQNPEPQPVDYAKARAVLQQFVDDLSMTEATLAKVKSDTVKVKVPFGLIRLDLDGNGKATEGEELWRLYARLTRFPGVDNGKDQQPLEQQAKGFVVGLDAGDVHWLRGYCHLLMAVGEFWLAHDSQELFKRTAHLIYPKAETPYEFLRHRPAGRDEMMTQILDAIAMIHLVRLEVIEPERMKRAHQHLVAVIEQSRQSWKLIRAETDNDHEWIPNPKQGTVIDVEVTDEMVASWLEFLDEAEQLLAGKKLLPFWRDPEKGINLRRVFEEPRTFDLVLWVQGTAAAPYLEDGPQTKPETWQEFQQRFRGQFIGFAIWFN